MKRKLPVLILAAILSFSLGGCASFLSYVRDTAEAVADAQDKAHQAALFQICRGMTVGAWVRHYGSDPRKADAWRTICTAYIVNVPKE